MELQLIQLYLWVCSVYDKHPMLKYQRLSNNWQPLFTDQELITIYLFGHLHGHYKQKRIYEYLTKHFAAWFPALPSYQVFNQRLNQLTDAFQVMVYELMMISTRSEYDFDGFVLEEDCVIDSLPIMLAVRSRAGRATVAPQLANLGYCASKDIYYHGVKMHILARKKYQHLPRPEMVTLTAAAVHDVVVRQECDGKIWGNAFGDKASQDEQLKQRWAAEGVNLCTPDKKRKQTQAYEVGKSGLWSRFVSAMRQPIESLFNWLNEQTEIQNGSKVRSEAGLLVHCYGKLAASLFILCFNP